MPQTPDFYVRFWGVRGSIACPGPETIRYGGNTSCLEIGCAGRLLVFDAGTGIHALGSDLQRNRASDDAFAADLFFTHTHFDHICGFPFFAPAFKPDSRLHIWAGHLLPERTVREVLIYLMMDPLFPIPIDTMRAKLDFHDFVAGESVAPHDGVVVRTAPLNHPNRATGYRIEFDGRAICYVTDTEHVPGKPDGNILELIRGADLFIYDCTYTDEEFGDYVNWGHSTWQEGVRLADQAGTKTLVVFHHSPDHDDDTMDVIARDVKRARPGSVVAREGMVLTP